MMRPPWETDTTTYVAEIKFRDWHHVVLNSSIEVYYDGTARAKKIDDRITLDDTDYTFEIHTFTNDGNEGHKTVTEQDDIGGDFRKYLESLVEADMLDSILKQDRASRIDWEPEDTDPDWDHEENL